LAKRVLSTAVTTPPEFLPGCPAWAKAIFRRPAAGNHGGRSETVSKEAVSNENAFQSGRFQRQRRAHLGGDSGEG